MKTRTWHFKLGRVLLGRLLFVRVTVELIDTRGLTERIFGPRPASVRDDFNLNNWEEL